MNSEPGHSDRMGSEGWRISVVLRIEKTLEGCSERGALARTPECGRSRPGSPALPTSPCAA